MAAYGFDYDFWFGGVGSASASGGRGYLGGGVGTSGRGGGGGGSGDGVGREWWRVVNGLAVIAVSGGFSGELVVVVVGATLAGHIQMLMHYTNVQFNLFLYPFLIVSSYAP